jgi:anti-sigma factor RsiW
MPSDPCAEFHLLIQADIDGELPPADAARVALHVAGCTECAQLQSDLIALGRRLRADAPRRAAGAATRASVAKRLRSLPARPAAGRRMSGLAGLASGLAIAASVLLLLPVAQGDGRDEALVSAHIRGLQPGHLTDVISTDRHTVKPWFDGRLNFSPVVKDLAADGFPLIGGRLDVIDGRDVAVMVYRHGQHYIDVFAWPAARTDKLRDAVGLDGLKIRDGYALTGWQTPDGIEYRAISSMDEDELDVFAALWKSR